ncbi:DUF3152 domain-containing protein [Rhizomonospora bruguierae]|uniref:DUF3152 domain-containing protein n=1 Tax=Rhizomonospora bruguierae TaxID=1581705 RepID=UPI0020BFD243|nr:DUF3152 domain-containing protein [Micromonospora sp. NBRC 107566]
MLYGQPRRPVRRTALALGFVIAVAVVVLLGMGAIVVVWAAERAGGAAPILDGGSVADGGPPRVTTKSTAAPAPGGARLTGGTGTFRVVLGSSPPVGSGRIYRYRIEVENGIDFNAVAFARDVDRILADPRGWTARGRWGFRRIPGTPADFVVKLATPATVDRICTG